MNSRRCWRSSAVVLGGLMVLAMGVGAEEAAQPAAAQEMDISKAKLLGVGAAGGIAGLKDKGAAHVTIAKEGSYGFTSGISQEKGSFRLGILMADFQAATQAGDKDRSKDAALALMAGLTALDAPHALLQSTANLVSLVHKGNDLPAVGTTARLLLLPHVKAFVENQGQLTYFHLGEWSETLSLMAAVGTSTGNEASNITAYASQAGSFAATVGQAQSTAPRLLEVLKEIQEVGSAKEPGPRDLQHLQSAVQALKTLLG